MLECGIMYWPLESLVIYLTFSGDSQEKLKYSYSRDGLFPGEYMLLNMRTVKM